MTTWVYCPKCGWIGKEFSDQKFWPPCKYCGGEFYTLEAESSDKSWNERIRWINHVFDTIVKPNPQFSQEAMKKRLEMQAAEEPDSAGKKVVPTRLQCSYCGSTRVQLVPRRRSVLAGFMAPKYDKICMNCHQKF